MFKRRLVILLILFAFALLVVAGRLVQLQIFRGEEYRTKAAMGLRSYEFPQGQRGRIFDRNGVILAEDVACHDLCLDYGFVAGEESWTRRQIRTMVARLGLDRTDPSSREKALAEIERRRKYTWSLVREVSRARGQNAEEAVERITRRVRRWREAAGTWIAEETVAHPVVTALSEEEVNALRPKMKDTIGAVLRPSHYRFYPQRSAACHIIGVTGPVFREEAEAWNWKREQAEYVDRMRHNLLPGDVVGKTGVERMCDLHLRPTRGVRVYLRPGELSYQEPPRNGQDVHLTLDVVLQKDLQNLLRQSRRNGAVVLLDVVSGDILAAASWPEFDLNTFRANYHELAGMAKQPSPKDPTKLVLTPAARRARIDRPLICRALAGIYPPGSTVKPFTALAAMGENLLAPGTPIACTGVNHRAKDSKPRCWIYNRYGQTHGILDLHGGLKNSCNIYFVEAGHRLGPQRLADWLRRFGFAERAGLGLSAGEEGAGMMKSEGFLPSDAWFMAIGQGFAATPLQVAAAHAAIARDGLYLSPRLSLESAPPQVRRQLPLTPAQAEAVRRGMHAVVHEPGGTAYKSWNAAGEPLDVEIGGKTGTATAPPLRIDTDGDGKRDTLVAKGDHAWFAGFAPCEKPQVAFAVILEYAGSGGQQAAPIAKEALRLCQKYGYLAK